MARCSSVALRIAEKLLRQDYPLTRQDEGAELRGRAQIGLNKGEAKNSAASGVFLKLKDRPRSSFWTLGNGPWTEYEFYGSQYCRDEILGSKAEKVSIEPKTPVRRAGWRSSFDITKQDCGN